MMMKLSLGTRIYYTGDMANADDAGTVVAVRPRDKFAPESYDIDLDDGRRFRGVYHTSFDAGSGRRFMPLSEWQKDRDDRIRACTLSMKHIRAHVYRNGKHDVYALCASDLASFIAMHGWTVANDLENMTDRDREELDRLGQLDELVIPDRAECGMTWQRWHDLHRVESTPCLTPDM
jgi:hypothetical protein